jgi:hypothetical protein
MAARKADAKKAEATALARACDVANSSEDVRAIEREFDALSADMAESWTDVPAR